VKKDQQSSKWALLVVGEIKKVDEEVQFLGKGMRKKTL